MTFYETVKIAGEMKKKSKIFVAGGSGMVGSAIIAKTHLFRIPEHCFKLSSSKIGAQITGC